jgi:hypothetical protein
MNMESVVLGRRVMKKSLSSEVVFRLMNLESFVADRVSTGVGFGSALLGLGIYLQIVLR